MYPESLLDVLTNDRLLGSEVFLLLLFFYPVSCTRNRVFSNPQPGFLEEKINTAANFIYFVQLFVYNLFLKALWNFKDARSVSFRSELFTSYI